jgi:hypothetical protein
MKFENIQRSLLLRATVALLLVISIGFIAFTIPSDVENLISGKVTTQAYIMYTPPENCSVYLHQGINVVSFFCATDGNITDGALKGLNGTTLNYAAIYVFNPRSLNDSWSSYNPSLPNWTIQSNIALNRRLGYVVVMNQPGTYYDEGLVFDHTTVALQTGWNLMGFPLDANRSVNVTFEQISGSYREVDEYKYFNNTALWLTYIPESTSTLEVLEPMQGYWIFINGSSSLNVLFN